MLKTFAYIAAAIDVAHGLGLGVVDPPEGVAADARHVRIKNRERGAGGNRGIDRRSTGPQHVDTCLRGQRMRASHHAVRREGGRTAGMYVYHEDFLGRFANG